MFATKRPCMAAHAYGRCRLRPNHPVTVPVVGSANSYTRQRPTPSMAETDPPTTTPAHSRLRS